MYRISELNGSPKSEFSSILNSKLKHNRMLSYELLSEKASKPMKLTCSEPGLIIHSAEEKKIPPHGQAIIKTDLKMTFPIGYYGLLCSIPEIITKEGLEVISAPIWNGMSSVDVILYNNNQKEVNIFPREMIAYLIIHKYYNGLYIFENKK